MILVKNAKMQDKTLKTLIFIFYISFACAYLSAGEYKTSLGSVNVLKIINSIPENDRKEIKSLFENLFKTHTFAYSLYGDKPMTYYDVSLVNSFSFLEIASVDQHCKEVLEIYSEPKKLLQERWSIWKKYRNHFPIKNYFFYEKSIGEQVRIILVNRKAIRETIDKHIDLFRRIISSNLSTEQLISQFENENTNIFDILHNHEGLLGILLGFGKRNAMLFQYREELLEKLDKIKIYGIYKLETIQHKLDSINARLQQLREHDHYIITSINRVCFIANPKYHETNQVKDKYDKLNKTLNDIYSKEDWFEQTLIQLTSN